MNIIKKIFFLSLLFIPVLANAQGLGSTGGSYQSDSGSWRRSAEDQVSILPLFEDSVGKLGIRNISNSERVFCYKVGEASSNYTGYTINDLSLISFCGVIEDDLKNILVSELLSNSNNMSTRRVNCIVKPQVLLRFVRGVDYTDVVLSSPCPSINIYHGGKVRSYNFENGAGIIDDIIDFFATDNVPFVSPALLNQVTPLGIVLTNEDRDTVNRSQGQAAPRSWEQEQAPSDSTPKSGWNKLM